MLYPSPHPSPTRGEGAAALIYALFAGPLSITYHDASSGAASDLKEASRLALAMVANLGLGDKRTLFSMDALAAFNIQPDTTLVIAEAEGVLASQNERCFEILRQYSAALNSVVSGLLEHETIDGSAVVKAVASVRAHLDSAIGVTLTRRCASSPQSRHTNPLLRYAQHQRRWPETQSLKP